MTNVSQDIAHTEYTTHDDVYWKKVKPNLIHHHRVYSDAQNPDPVMLDDHVALTIQCIAR